MTYVLSGRYPLGSLDGRPGVLKFVPSTTIVGDGNVVLPAPVVVRLDAAGAFSQALIGTDDPLYAPSGWVWTVTEVMTGGRDPWSFELTADSDIADLATVATPAVAEYAALQSTTITAGAGLTGGGTLAADRTLNVAGNVLGFGAIGDGVADDTAAIQSALDAGLGSVYVPAGTYLISDSLRPAAGVTIRGDGDLSVIHQTVWPKPAFDMFNNAGVTIRDLRGVNTATRTQTMTENRDSTLKSQLAFVFSQGNRTRVLRCSVSGFELGVHMNNWDNATGAVGATPISGCEVDGLRVDDVWVGVFSKNFDGLRIRNVTGSYVQPGSQAPHLLYIGSEESTIEPNYGLQVADCYAWDSPAGHAYQFKGIIGGQIKNLVATGCGGVLSLMGCDDTTWDGVVSLDDRTTGGLGSLSMQSSTALNRCTITNVSMQMVNDQCAIRLLDGVACQLNYASVTVAHTGAGTNAKWDMEIRGGWEVNSPRVVNTGTHCWRSIGLWLDGAVVRDPFISGAQIGVEIKGSATNALVEVNPAKITLHADGHHKLDNLSPTSRIVTNANRAKHAEPTLAISNFIVAMSSTNYLMGVEFGPVWEMKAGAWYVEEDDGYVHNTTASAGTATLNAGSSSVTVESEVGFRDGVGIALHTIDTANLVVCRIRNATTEILKRVANADTVLATLTEAHTNDARYLLRATTRNGVIDFHVDGVLKLSYTLAGADATQFAAITTHGMRTGSDGGLAKFYNFTVTKA